MNTTQIKVNIRCEKYSLETISSSFSNHVKVLKSTYSINDTQNLIQLEFGFEHQLDQDSIFRVEGVSVFKVHNYYLDTENSPFIAKELFKLTFNRIASNYLNGLKTSDNKTHQILQYPHDHIVSLVPYDEVFQSIPFGRPHFSVTIPSHSLLNSRAT